MTLGDLLRATAGRAPFDAQGGVSLGDQAVASVMSVTSDSREVARGSVFVALRGLKADGTSFIHDSLARGAIAVVAEVASPPGTPVRVGVGAEVSAGRYWAVLEVADSGPGLSAEEGARVFERFYRTDASRARRTGGTGLGLSIVAALVAAHGGEVTVDSSPGQGATFRVRLPALN